ncbi:unnamed protein product [Closterium sp. NIES-53]
MYLMTCTRPDLAYPLSLLARYVAPGRHQKVHWDAAKRVLRYLCSTSGMGLVLGGRARIVLTGHADVSWVDDLATQRSSNSEAEIYAGAMAAQELRWLTYLLERRTKHIALRYFLARELQQCGQLRLAYVASQANTADVFTKALQPSCFVFLDWSCDPLFSPTLPMGPFSPPPDTHSLVLRPFRLRFLSSPHGFPAPEMVIAGAPEPTPELAAAWSTVVARPPAEPESATMATKPPLPPAPKHVTAVFEKTPPHAPAAPLSGAEAGPSAPAAVSSAPPASLGPLAPLVEPSASASAGGIAEPSAPVPGALVAPNASAPCLPAQASASSPKAASATTGEPAPSVAPAAAGQSASAVTAVVPAGQPSRPSSPDRRSSRPHSLAPHQDRKSSRRRRESPRRYQQQSHWPAHPGGQGDWRGPRARAGGEVYRPPVTMADLQREVSRAFREERAAQSQSSSLRALPAHEAPRPAALPPNPQPVAAPPPQIQALPAPSPAVLAPAPGSRLHLPPVPPVAGVEFVAAGGGSLVAPFALPADANEPLLFLAEALQPPQTRVPEATLGQLHCLADSLHALLLIQVLAHSSLPVIPP